MPSWEKKLLAAAHLYPQVASLLIGRPIQPLGRPTMRQATWVYKCAAAGSILQSQSMELLAEARQKRALLLIWGADGVRFDERRHPGVPFLLAHSPRLVSSSYPCLSGLCASCS